LPPCISVLRTLYDDDGRATVARSPACSDARSGCLNVRLKSRFSRAFFNCSFVLTWGMWKASYLPLVCIEGVEARGAEGRALTALLLALHRNKRARWSPTFRNAGSHLSSRRVQAHNSYLEQLRPLPYN
jgi:hypothetical protein